MKCVGCNQDRQDVREGRETMTAYVKEELNVVPALCDDCYEDYRTRWQEQWDAYHQGLL